MKVDILAIGVHPDDIELSCSGTLIKHIQQGKSVAIVDLTQGELGTRGSAELRLKEADDSAKVLGVKHRENIGLADGFFDGSKSEMMKLISKIRKYQPQIVLANSIEDRHPDHGRAAKFISDACFYSGLRKIETIENGKSQDAWRPQSVYHYIQDYYIKPDFIVDISEQYDKKLESIMSFKSQFYDPNSTEPSSPISGKEFLDFIEGRAMQYGRLINVKYGEGFIASRPIGIKDITLID